MRWSLFVIVILCFIYVESNRYADQLYEDLLYYYNKNVRPVKNASESVKVKFGSSLIRIIDVDEVNQVLTTNLWLEMQWFDSKLSWDPAKWGEIKKLHVPSDQIWIPDILLYNNADGEPHITIMSDALVYYNGLVVWKPPSIYKSFCPINIEYFPYDSQSCTLKFGGWSYNGFLLDVRQLPTPGTSIINKLDEDGKEIQYLELGMDLSGFYPSLEWDLMSLTSKRHEKLYPGCCGQEFYIDVSFVIDLRRKTLFYTVNLVIPCMLIALLTIFVFYIPPIEHKMTYSISILVTLTVFYLVLIELIPPTSLVIPLIGKYLLFTMFLVSLSIVLSVVSLNYYRRDGSAHPMPSWVHLVFIQTLPKWLCLKPAEEEDCSDKGSSTSEIPQFMDSSRRPSPFFLSVPQQFQDGQMRLNQLAQLRGMHPDLIRRMIDNVAFIADHFRAIKKEDKISSDWSYVANVIDRLVLILFLIVNVIGTIYCARNSPVLFDTKEPLTIVTAIRPLSGDTFESKFSENFTMQTCYSIKADLGNELTPTLVQHQPKLTWDAKEDKLYTIVMTDPDAPSRAKPIRREYKHWVQLNVPSGEVEKGEFQTEYIGAGPPEGTGLHRYVVLVYEQSSRLPITNPVTKNSSADRASWNVEKFARELQLKGPIAVNYFQAQYDSYVPKLHKQLSGH